jgi:Ca2+-binding EF-hand superfamily protein
LLAPLCSMATSLTAEELELCKKAFQAFDKDGAAAR